MGASTRRLPSWPWQTCTPTPRPPAGQWRGRAARRQQGVGDPAQQQIGAQASPATSPCTPCTPEPCRCTSPRRRAALPSPCPLPLFHSKSEKERARAEVHFSHAMELYRRVLEKDEGAPPRCRAAGHGSSTREPHAHAQGLPLINEVWHDSPARRACPPPPPLLSCPAPLPWHYYPAGCISAANGVGCILAELGNLPAAKEVFLQVGEGRGGRGQKHGRC